MGRRELGMKKIVQTTSLKANSPKGAFYNLAIVQIRDGYLVRKESGAGERVLHREAWFRESYEEANRLYCRILKEKTNPKRKSPRKYSIISQHSHITGCGL